MAGPATRPAIPVMLVVYDVVGTVLFALGAGRQFVDLALIPDRLLWPGYPIPFMVAGLLLTLPLLAWVIRQVRASGATPAAARNPNSGPYDSRGP